MKAKGLNDAQNASLDEVAAALRRLAPYGKRMKSLLSPSALQDFRSVVSAVTILRGTDHYERLKRMIVDAFPSKPYDIGTVGAYFVNCLDSASRDACAAPCVGNLVLEDGTEDICPMRVFALKYEGSSTRSLMAVNDVPDNSKAIVYIYLDPARKMGGLTAGEIDSLANLGVKEVNVNYYDPSTFEQVPVTSGFVPIDTLTPVPNHKTDSSSNFWVVFFAIIVVLIIIFVVWQMAKKPAKK